MQARMLRNFSFFVCIAPTKHVWREVATRQPRQDDVGSVPTGEHYQQTLDALPQLVLHGVPQVPPLCRPHLGHAVHKAAVKCQHLGSRKRKIQDSRGILIGQIVHHRCRLLLLTAPLVHVSHLRQGSCASAAAIGRSRRSLVVKELQELIPSCADSQASGLPFLLVPTTGISACSKLSMIGCKAKGFYCWIAELWSVCHRELCFQVYQGVDRKRQCYQ